MRLQALICSKYLYYWLIQAYFPLKDCHIGIDDYENSNRNDERNQRKWVRQKLVYTYIRELLDSDKEIKENNNLELLDNYLLDKDQQEVSKNAPEILMAAELLDAYLLDKRFMRELEDEEYDAA